MEPNLKMAIEEQSELLREICARLSAQDARRASLESGVARQAAMGAAADAGDPARLDPSSPPPLLLAWEASRRVPVPTQSAAVGADVVADNWGDLFDSGDDSDEQSYEEPIIADNWGGFFGGEDTAANAEFAGHWDSPSSNPDVTACVTPEVAVESATHVVPGATYMEASTTYSTPGLTKHATTEALKWCRESRPARQNERRDGVSQHGDAPERGWHLQDVAAAENERLQVDKGADGAGKLLHVAAVETQELGSMAEAQVAGVDEVAGRPDSSTFHEIADDGAQLGERVAELVVPVSCGVEDGEAANARKLFDEMPERTIVSWTTIMNGFAVHYEVVRLLMDMLTAGVQGNSITFVYLLKSCGKRGDVRMGQQVHCCVVKGGWSNVIVDNAVTHFYGALEAAYKRNGVPALIAEVKKASPNRGVLREDFNPVEIAQAYEKNGAACLSILTDEKYFQGSFENLEKVRTSGVKCPLLCKEFVIDKWQIYNARSKGADAILLIAAVLPDLDIRKFLQICEELGMTALIEVHDEREMERVLNINGVKLIGINNRSLETFVVDTSNTKMLLEKHGDSIREKGILVVGESGLFTPEDVAYVQNAGVSAVLVGESLVKQECPGRAIVGLFGKELLH